MSRNVQIVSKYLIYPKCTQRIFRKLGLAYMGCVGLRMLAYIDPVGKSMIPDLKNEEYEDSYSGE